MQRAAKVQVKQAYRIAGLARILEKMLSWCRITALFPGLKVLRLGFRLEVYELPRLKVASLPEREGAVSATSLGVASRVYIFQIH